MTSGNDFVLDELQYNILQTVTSPLDDLSTFMGDILGCFKNSLDAYGYLFYRYEKDPCNPEKYVACDQVSMNLPESVYGDEWRRDYYDTSIFNPNAHKSLLTSDKSVFVVSDLFSPEEYENNRNYRELLKPAGIYYSFAVIFKQGDVPLGHLTLSRSKDMGPFDSGALTRIEKMSGTIRNKLLDYKKLSQYSNLSGLESFIDRGMSQRDIGAMLLTEDYKVIFYNDRAAQFCGDLLASLITSDEPSHIVQRVATQLSVHCAPRYCCFEQLGRNGKTFYCTSTPCFIKGEGGIMSAYLVQLSPYKKAICTGNASSAGPKELTRRQTEIVHLIADGMSNKEIADELMISEGTVKKHVENIRILLGVNSRIGILKELHIV